MSTSNNAEAMRLHWMKTRNLTYVVLAVWFVFSILVHVFAQSLNTISFIGFPLGYYLAVQGSLVVFVVIIFVQNFFQDKIDAEYSDNSVGAGS